MTATVGESMVPARLRRSELVTPGSSQKMIAQAATSDADVVILDLEDAVTPASKSQARANVITAFNQLDFGRSARAYRINGLRTQWCHDDIIEVVTNAGRNVDLVVVPKAQSPREVWFVDDLLTSVELKLELPVGGIKLEILIEDVEAVVRAVEIAAASPRIEALVLGVGDLAASQRMRLGHIGETESGRARDYPGDVWHHARSQVILASRMADVDAIDGPHADYSSLDGFERSAASFAVLGGAGKWCIHPSQIAAANEVFSPTEAEIAEALSVIEAVSIAEASGAGAAHFAGRMIDAASARSFKTTLERGRACGVI